MKYSNIVKGTFLSRPNRFIAHVLIDGKEEVVHVKNTGRCKELLLPGAVVFLQDCQSPSRKTRYDLISVFKGERLINMDSQVPNKVVYQWLQESGYLPKLSCLKKEQTFGNSRFDLYAEYEDGLKKAYIEVKGVTLEQDNVAMFPDAPTQRGAKHLRELIEAKHLGYEAFVVFVIQMEGMDYFTPHRNQDPDFAKALEEASNKGVQLLAFECHIEPDTIKAGKMIPIRL